MVVTVSERKTSSGSQLLLIVAPLDIVHQGVVYEHIPPHLTVLPWFELPNSRWSAFTEGMEELVIEERLSNVKGARAARYGQYGTLPVRELCGELLGVHAHALNLVKWLGCTVDPMYTGHNYSPHVSDKPERVIAEGEPIDFPGLAVFRKEAGLKQVAEFYPWPEATRED